MATRNSEMATKKIFRSPFCDLRASVTWIFFFLLLLFFFNRCKYDFFQFVNVTKSLCICLKLSGFSFHQRGRPVPVLIPPDCRKALAFLANTAQRKKAKIAEGNLYLFPNSGRYWQFYFYKSDLQFNECIKKETKTTPQKSKYNLCTTEFD